MDSYYQSNDESYVSELHSQSESYFQEVGGDNGNFYGSSSHFQDSMINQMRFIAEENRELKRCIRTNNKELRSKMLELQAWKAELKNNGAKTTLNFKKTKTIVTSLREENALLSATNAKLELKLSDFMGSMDGDLAAAKLLKNFENLESRYKTVLATRNEKEKLCVELSGQLDACRAEVERLKTSKERDLAQLKTYNNLLHKETDKWKREAELQKKLCQDKDQEIQDMKTQVVKLIGDNGDYKNQLQQAQDANKHLKRDAAQQAYLHQERVQKFTDDQLRMQKQLDDKQLTMDHLWKDYNKHKEDKEKIEAQHAKCANQQGMVDHYMAQMISAEESLSKKTADLKETEDRYRKELWSAEDRLKKELENVQFFKSQADVYKQDWVIEREEAAKIREQMENYKRMLHEKEQMLQRYTSLPDPSFVRHR